MSWDHHPIDPIERCNRMKSPCEVHMYIARPIPRTCSGATGHCKARARLHGRVVTQRHTAHWERATTAREECMGSG